MARQRRGTVAVYSRGRGLDPSIVKRVKLAEATTLLDEGRAFVMSEQPFAIQLCDGPRQATQAMESRPSKPTIVKTEVEANAYAMAGFKDHRSRTKTMPELQKLHRMHHGRQPEDYIERVTDKITAWPDECDRLAVRTGPAATIGLAQQEARRQAQMDAARE